MSKFRVQDIASYAAVVVAVVALYVGWDQSRIIRNQQHADVYPVVQIKTQNLTKTSDEGVPYREVMFELFNAGVGPAFLENANWKIGTTNIKRVSDIVKSMPDGLTPVDQYQGQFSNMILAAGETAVVWQAVFSKDEVSNALTNDFMQQFWDMDMEICYCSLYERCWKSKFLAASARPKSVEMCKP
jgi:hypothetical protein